MNQFACITLLALAATVAGAPARADETVLKEAQVTKDALIDSLAPAAAADTADAGASAAESAESAPRMRGLKLMMHSPATGGAATAARAGHASILITFVTDSAELTPKAKEALDVLASAMKSERLASVHFTIEGHADPRGNDKHNQQLSQARADSVRAYLMSAHGLAAERIAAVGKGSSDPLLPNDPAAPENRRVTIVAQP